MPIVIIDNQEHKIETSGRNLLDVCLSLGYNVPYFCWHPAMHSVGACRQCAVKQFKDENDTRGRIVMSCMTPASDGTRISIDDPDAVAFRKSVIEWLMVNHPHDCPVCDEGGECHLQDMTVMSGHNYRRYRFTKRTHRNQDMGPFINHEMNRCIQCYRCVRFYRDYAGGRDFNVLGWHDRVFFGRFEDGTLENEFSGNLADICPTGVFTDKSLREHYTRKWDLRQAPSVCVHCGLGCNIFGAERYGTLRRIKPRYNHLVNGYFLCDRGRYGYGFVNSAQRVRQPKIRRGDGGLLPCSSEEAGQRVLEIVRQGKVLGIGSARATLEANFSLRYLVDEANFYHGMSERTYELVREVVDILRCGTARAAALQEVARDDAALVLGEDVTNAAPLLALSLRQTVLQKPMREARELKIDEFRDSALREAVQVGRGPLYILTSGVTKLDDQTTNHYRVAPADVARFGFAVAHAIHPGAPAVTGLPEDLKAAAQRCAEEFLAAECPVIVSGFTCGSRDVIRAAANVAWALGAKGKPADLFYTMPECNSMGVGLLGGKGLNAALEAVRSGEAETLIILENDITRQMDVDLAFEMLDLAKNVIVIDHLPTATTEHADILLPAATFAESMGTLVNNEGRGQRLLPVQPPTGDVRDSWRWIGDIMTDYDKRGCEVWCNLEGVMRFMAETVPDLAKVVEISPRPSFRMFGRKIPRELHRYSGRTAMRANVSVHEPKPPQDYESPLSYTMEGYEGMPPPSLITHAWAPGWNSVQAWNKYQIEVGGPLRGGDPGVRLVEPAEGGTTPYFFTDVPEGFEPREDALLIMPDYLIYGSELLSMQSGPVAQRAPEPYVAMSPPDMARLEVKAGEVVSVRVAGVTYEVKAVSRPSLPVGVALLPVGLNRMVVLGLPEWGQVQSKRHA